jgi:hypothetical protein
LTKPTCGIQQKGEEKEETNSLALGELPVGSEHARIGVKICLCA